MFCVKFCMVYIHIICNRTSPCLYWLMSIGGHRYFSRNCYFVVPYFEKQCLHVTSSQFQTVPTFFRYKWSLKKTIKNLTVGFSMSLHLAERTSCSKMVGGLVCCAWIPSRPYYVYVLPITRYNSPPPSVTVKLFR